MPAFLAAGPADGPVLVLAHGAGAPMDSPAMQAITDALAAEGLRVVRFEFAYMAARRDGARRPPPKAELLIGEYRAVLSTVRDETGSTSRTLVIGGKSMGGRVASMLVDDLMAEYRPAGLVCFGYPFHPPGKPQQTRTAHLADLATPALIVQGTRDPFGTLEDVAGYALSPAIRLHWVEDGDHDLRARRAVTGLSIGEQLAAIAKDVRDWVDTLER